MKMFKDSMGRDWTITVNYDAIQRVKAMVGLDLLDISVFEKLGNDPIKLLDVLHAICEPQLKDKQIDKPAFVNAIAGDPIDDASTALTDEIIDFFPKRRRETLKKILATAQQVQDKAITLVNERLESGELLKQLEAQLSGQSGNSPESSESIQDLSRSETST